MEDEPNIGFREPYNAEYLKAEKLEESKLHTVLLLNDPEIILAEIRKVDEPGDKNWIYQDFSSRNNSYQNITKDSADALLHFREIDTYSYRNLSKGAAPLKQVKLAGVKLIQGNDVEEAKEKAEVIKRV